MFSQIKIPPKQVYEQLIVSRAQKIANLQHTLNLLQWDQKVTISSSSDSSVFAARNTSMNALQYEIFKEFHKTDLQRGCLFLLSRPKEETGLSELEYANTRELHRQIFRLTKIPRSVMSRRVQKGEYVDTAQLWQYCYSRRDWNNGKFLEALERDFDYAKIAGEAMASAENKNNLLEVHNNNNSNSENKSSSFSALTAMDGWLLHQELMLSESRVDKLIGNFKTWVPHAFHLSKKAHLEQRQLNGSSSSSSSSFERIFLGDDDSSGKRDEVFCRALIQKLGFDITKGRIDFTSSTSQGDSYFIKGGTLPISSNDVRIIVSKEKMKTPEESFANLLLHVVRQCGKALYEQNRPHSSSSKNLLLITDQPVSLPRSLALSEAQSILFERHLLSRPSFMKFLINLSQEQGFSSSSMREQKEDAEKLSKKFLQLTKNDSAFSEMESLLKFCAGHEIERNVLLKKNSIDQVPQMWRQKFEEYNLHRHHQSDSSTTGTPVLYDDFMFELESLESAKFWAQNQFGYVPTFALGNLYASFLFEALKNDIYQNDEMKLDSDIENGRFDKIMDWLKIKIWTRGSIHLNTPELLTKVSSEKACDDESLMKYYQSYLWKKMMN